MKYTKALKLFILLNAYSGLSAESWIVDTQSEWLESTSSQTHLNFENGMVSPTAKTATFQSTLKSFNKKRLVGSITLSQSPIWLNWEPTENIGTRNMHDAPVLLSLGPNNYWMFARFGGSRIDSQIKDFKPEPVELEGFDIPLETTPAPNQFRAPGGKKRSLGGYSAWQSRDMKNWVLHGSITERFSKWMTTAEYADGNFYFYYDFPNDQDPHVYVDSDPTDGLTGENVGLVFEDPTHGSDVAFIRDLEGKFHVIYEDWTPINAREHAWDSPLAGHAVSDTGLGDFTILDHVVDDRTTATGEKGTFTHPHWNKEDPENYPTSIAEYDIHEPDQPAYGDWAAISIGGHYYLFGDYEPAASKQMSVAMLTTMKPGLGNEKFQFFNNIGSGHPDPDICFAEGRFWLATQQPRDFVSDGPWVESVSVRVGVDTDNDAQIDQWTEWQEVKETYDYTPGFAKQVKRIPAALDLSELPAGYGFQYELKLTDTTENESKPVLDRVKLEFAL